MERRCVEARAAAEEKTEPATPPQITLTFLKVRHETTPPGAVFTHTTSSFVVRVMVLIRETCVRSLRGPILTLMPMKTGSFAVSYPYGMKA